MVCYSSRKTKSVFYGMEIKHFTGQSLVKVSVPNADKEQQCSIIKKIESRLSVCDSIEKQLISLCNKPKPCGKAFWRKHLRGGL